jgi:hypothetical protein
MAKTAAKECKHLRKPRWACLLMNRKEPTHRLLRVKGNMDLVLASMYDVESP